jgi:hypothetical protein
LVLRRPIILIWMKRAGRRLGAIALLAILVRAIVPAGYMLAGADTPGGRHLVVQMCDGHGAATVVALFTGHIRDLYTLPGKSNGQSDSSRCAFAVSPAMASPPVAAQTDKSQQASSNDLVVALAETPSCGIAAPPPPSTGPPTLN